MKIFAAKTVDLGSGPIPRLILTLAVPAMISMFFQNLYAFIDTIFISWLGPVPLAAQAFSIPLFYIALSLGKGVQVGTATLISHARGSGDESQVGALARAALPLLLLLILPLFLLLIPRLSDLVFGLMGAKGLMLDQIYRYIFWLILGFPVMAYFMVCEAVFYVPWQYPDAHAGYAPGQFRQPDPGAPLDVRHGYGYCRGITGRFFGAAFIGSVYSGQVERI